MTVKNVPANNARLQHSRFWMLAFAAFAGLVWVLKPILLPFAAGLVLAYFLNPVVDGLTRRKMPRWLGTLLVLFGFLLIVALLFVLTAPLVQKQILALIEALPGHIDTIRAWAEKLIKRLSPQQVENLRDTAGQLAGNAAQWGGTLLKGVISEGAAIFNIFALAIITPVVAFYLLRDWPNIVTTVDKYLPRKYYDQIQEILKDINRALSGFLRGQALVCLALGIIYSIGLSLTGLKYGATIGIIAGFLSFVPYVGSTFVLVTSTILAFIQFDSMWDIGPVLLVFIVGQTLEGYVLTPKLVGDRVGLHPVWILFAILAGGSLLGFVGVLIAVPVAAIVGVLVRFFLRHYRSSRYYHHD